MKYIIFHADITYEIVLTPEVPHRLSWDKGHGEVHASRLIWESQAGSLMDQASPGLGTGGAERGAPTAGRPLCSAPFLSGGPGPQPVGASLLPGPPGLPLLGVITPSYSGSDCISQPGPQVCVPAVTQLSLLLPGSSALNTGLLPPQEQSPGR